nr:hypothetical protein [uncultured Rhodopila sp.]
MSNYGLAKVPTAGVAFEDEAPRHIRGTIASVRDHAVAVTTARGATHDDAKVFTIGPANISAIKDGKFIGLTSVEKGGNAVADRRGKARPEAADVIQASDRRPGRHGPARPGHLPPEVARRQPGHNTGVAQ